MKWPRLRDPAPASEEPASEPAAERSPAAFLSRWSRRKQALRQAEAERAAEDALLVRAGEAEAPPTLTLPAASGGRESVEPVPIVERRRAAPPSPRLRRGGPTRAERERGGGNLEAGATGTSQTDDNGEAPVLTEPEPPLPAIEEITAETDISLFLRKGVADTLRNAALRKMWSLDPAIRDYVGDARDYAYDWNVPGGVPGFGPIEPGYDVAGTLSRMFSRTGPDSAAEAELSASAQPEPALAAAPSPTLPAPPADAENLRPELAAASVPEFDPQDPAAPPRAADRGELSERRARLRHGGATPS